MRRRGALVIPSYEEVKADKDRFCEAQKRLSNRRTIAQKHANRFVVQYPAPDYGPADLDRVFGLPFTHRIPEGFPELGMARFSVQTHRGCVGRCSFCALSLHQGDRIVSRSEGSVLEEIRRMTKHPEWKGVVDDLGGPTANMYGMARAAAETRRGGAADVQGGGKEETRERLKDGVVAAAHRRLIGLMRAARKVPGVKKVFVRSGIRYDLVPLVGAMPEMDAALKQGLHRNYGHREQPPRVWPPLASSLPETTSIRSVARTGRSASV